MQELVLAMLLSVAPFLSGCSCLNWMAYVAAPAAPTKTIDPSYTGLKGKTVAIVILAGPNVLLDYQTIQLEMSDAIAAELRGKLGNVTIVNPMRVIRYQDENPRWEAQPPERLCATFGADAVLLVTIIDFSTREPGSAHLTRGRVLAEASVYTAAKDHGSPTATTPAGGASAGQPVWRSQQLAVMYPAESPLGLPTGDDRPIRLKTCQIFAQELVQSFYAHKGPKE